MSALAIAGVSATLKSLTENHFAAVNINSSLGTTPNVSVLPPDQAEKDFKNKDGVNWFMYRTSNNSGLQNNFNPVRESNGNRINRAPLPLDLHYIVSTYGKSDMHADILLGYVLQLFHDNPILNRETIAGALATGSGSIFTALSNENISDHLNQIRLTMEHPDEDFMSNVWGVFNTNYRPSVIFHASVALIETPVSFQTGIPVQRYDVNVYPLNKPHIDQIESLDNPSGLVSFGNDIRIIGSNLAQTNVRVQIGLMTLEATDLDEIQREFIDIEGTALADVRAGVNAVRIIHDLDLGIPSVAHRGYQSNVVALVIHPTFINLNVSLSGGGPNPRHGDISLTIQPPVHRDQRVKLLLNEVGTSNPTGYTFVAPPRTNNTPESDFTFEVSGIVAGNYFVRVEVDGAASQLSVNPTKKTINESPIALS